MMRSRLVAGPAIAFGCRQGERLRRSRALTTSPTSRRAVPIRAMLAFLLAFGSLAAVAPPAAAACVTPQSGHYLGTWQSSVADHHGVGEVDLTFAGRERLWDG